MFNPRKQCGAADELAPAEADHRNGRAIRHAAGDDIGDMRFGAVQQLGDLRQRQQIEITQTIHKRFCRNGLTSLRRFDFPTTFVTSHQDLGTGDGGGCRLFRLQLVFTRNLTASTAGKLFHIFGSETE